MTFILSEIPQFETCLAAVTPAAGVDSFLRRPRDEFQSGTGIGDRLLEGRLPFLRAGL